MGQRANASTKAITMSAMGTIMRSPRAQGYPAFENILQKIIALIAATTITIRTTNTIIASPNAGAACGAAGANENVSISVTFQSSSAFQ